MTKRNLTKHGSMKTRPLLQNPEILKKRREAERGRAGARKRVQPRSAATTSEVHDITERKHAEESISHLAAIVDSSDDAIIGRTLDGVITSWNRGAENLYGYSAEEAKGKPISILFPPNRRDELVQILERVKRGERIQHYETQRMRKDCTIIEVSLTVSPIRDPTGGIVGASAIARDITERKRAEEERAEYAIRLLALHTHASQLSSAKDIDTIVKCTLDAMEIALGFEHTDFLLVEKDALQGKGRRGIPVAFSAQPLNGRGLTVKAANTKSTLRISDTRKEPAYVDAKGFEWTGPPTVLSELIVPVLTDGEVVAVLCVDSTRTDNFNDDDQRLLETLAIHVGSALGRLRQVEELEIMARFPSENPDPILRLDRHGTVLSANQASKALLQDWGSGIRQPAPKPWRDLVTDVLSSGEGRSIDIELGGRSYTFLVRPIVEGDYVNLYGVDITERKEAEKALRESEEKYRVLIDNASDFIFMVDREDRVLSLNKAAARLLGREPEEIVRKSIYDLFPNEIAAEYSRRLKEVFRTGESKTMTERMIAQRNEMWILTSLNPVRNPEGKIAAVTGVSRDITERTHIEKALQESEEKYRAIVENSPNFTGIFQDGALKYINSVAILKLGWTYEELLSPSFDPIENLVSQKSRSLLKENVGKRLRGEDIAPYEISLTRKDGSEIPVLVRAAKIIYNQKPAIEFVFDDITERKQAEEKLRESEERYRSLFDRMLDGVYLSTHAGRFVDINPAFVKMFGYSSKQEMLDIGDIKKELYYSPEERGSHILDADQEEVKVYRMRRKDGSEIWVEDHGGYVHDEQGNIVYHEGILRDITERKRAEELLRASEMKYRWLFEEMPHAIYQTSPEGKMLTVNPAFTKLFGYDSEKELAAIDVERDLYVNPEDRRRWRTDIETQGEVRDVELVLKRKNGEKIIVLDSAHTVRDERGTIQHYEGTLTDITERKRLQEELKQYSLHLEELVNERTGELRESEVKYRELFDACPVSLWEEDFSVVKQFVGELRQKGISNFGAYFASHSEDVAKCAGMVKVLNVNKATLNLYNAKSVDEIIGGLSGVLTEESNRKQFLGELVALAQGKKYYEAEMENRTLQGETKHCNVICAVVPGYGQSLAKVLVCIVDLTPQKKLEAELVKSQRLAAIGETAAMVGHDLRNPLQGIAGAAYNIRRHLRNALDPSTKEMLAVIDNGVQYANGIINELLEFSREMQVQLLPTTPKSIVRKTLTDVRMPHNITIEDATADAPEILVDEPKIKRLLTNLIQNAIDAMPEGGKLSFSSMKTQKEVLISVRDTGLGIPREMVERIWTPLHTTKAKGIGLGLPICRRIIEAHGGSISVESTVGKGTTFTLKLPIQQV